MASPIRGPGPTAPVVPIRMIVCTPAVRSSSTAMETAGDPIPDETTDTVVVTADPTNSGRTRLTCLPQVHATDTAVIQVPCAGVDFRLQLDEDVKALIQKNPNLF